MKITNKRSMVAAVIIIIFGTLTLFSGWKALFTDAGISTRGNIVPPVLWFNFIAGFFYLTAGVLTFYLNSLVKKIAFGLAISSFFVSLYLANYIYQGGSFEIKTVVAMTFRTCFWICFAIYFHKSQMFKK